MVGGRAFPVIAPADGLASTNRLPTFSWGEALDAESGNVKYMLLSGVGAYATGLTETSFTLSTPLEDGHYQWGVAALRPANRTETVDWDFYVDTERPESFQLRSPLNGACVAVPTPNLCWDNPADETTGIASREVGVNATLAAPSSVSGICLIPDAALAPGEHAWYGVVTDRAGNARQSSKPFFAGGLLAVNGAQLGVAGGGRFAFPTGDADLECRH